MLNASGSRRAAARPSPSQVLPTALALCVILVLGACAAPPGDPSPNSRVTTIGVQSRNFDDPLIYDLRHQADVGRRTVPASPTAVWGVLADVFDQLEIDVGYVDASAGVMGNEGSRVRRIEGVRLSRWLDCGMGSVQAVADSHQVTLAVMVQLLPTENGTTVQTTVDAAARDRSQSSGSLHCVSHGRLEQRIPQLVMERLGIDS